MYVNNGIFLGIYNTVACDWVNLINIKYPDLRSLKNGFEFYYESFIMGSVVDSDLLGPDS